MRVLEPELQLASTARGPASGPRQIVARGELRASLLAALMTAGSMAFIADCESVASGFASPQV
eukprot:2609187-Pyramimonas_sp.AAC.1